MQFGMLQGAAKLQKVTQLLASLEKDLKESTLTSQERVQTLLELRQHGTNPKDADPIYSKDGFEVLIKYGVDGETADVRRSALRCVANALLLNPNMRQVFVDTGYAGRLAEGLKCDASDDEMMTSRILFFSSDRSTMDVEKLVNEHALGINLNYQISRHAAQFPESGKAALSQMDELALTDTLKLTYLVASRNAKLAEIFSPSLPHMFTILNRADIPAKPLDEVVGQLINCISVLDNEGGKVKQLEDSIIFPTTNENGIVDKLIKVLDKTISVYSPAELESRAIPLLYILTVICEKAPNGPREHMKRILLPESEDRSQPIGQSDTLPSKLLETTKSPYSQLRILIFELMFVLSDRDAETLTKNIGYGYASGFLATRGMEVPKMGGTGESGGLDPEINPITGQKWSAEPQDTGPPMTREEKEREAERLFVLFERARANGILNVENPVRVAQQEGRFEELSDSDDE